MVFRGGNLSPVFEKLIQRVTDVPEDAAAALDLSTIAQLMNQPSERIALQSAALEIQAHYRQPATISTGNPTVLLAFMAAGDFMANHPIEFLVSNSNVTLDMLYINDNTTLSDIPDHDVAIVAISESEANNRLLRHLTTTLSGWKRPIINRPDCIARLSRDGAWELLYDIPRIKYPKNERVTRDQLIDRFGYVLTYDTSFIIRPIDSHAGRGLEKIDDMSDLECYLANNLDYTFYVAPFIDYRSSDGMYRKYRVVVIQGKAFACHMAISKHWMVHYLNAGMMHEEWKRVEERTFMETFDIAFGFRHAPIFQEMFERTGLEYLPIDCSETSDGDLLLFECGTSMIVHAMDSPTVFPYKQVATNKIFSTFQTMVNQARIAG